MKVKADILLKDINNETQQDKGQLLFEIQQLNKEVRD